MVSELVSPEVADPPERVTGPPKLVESTRNWTEPSGVPPPLPEGVMTAVKWMPCPMTDGLADDETEAVVPDGLTVWVTDAVTVLVAKFGSPA